MNALPTFVNLQRRVVNICDICPACGMEPESNLHVFVSVKWLREYGDVGWMVLLIC